MASSSALHQGEKARALAQDGAGETGLGASSFAATDNREYTIVDHDDQIEPALAKLRERGRCDPTLAVNCDGQDVSRMGELSIVAVARKSHVYLFDIKTLGAKVFDRGLRDLLEDPSIEKFTFDCREDSDCLWHQFKVKLANVMDLQLLQVIYGESHPGRPRHRLSNPPCPQPLLLGFLSCLKLYAKDEKLIQLKLSCKPLMANSGAIWLKRPLPEKLLQSAALSVRGYFALFLSLIRGTGGSRNVLPRLRVASQRYLDFFRSREVRLYDKYERNSYVPWRVVPRPGQAVDYSEETACVGCKRLFPRSDFIPVQLQKGVQKCPVCRNVYME